MKQFCLFPFSLFIPGSNSSLFIVLNFTPTAQCAVLLFSFQPDLEPPNQHCHGDCTEFGNGETAKGDLVLSHEVSFLQPSQTLFPHSAGIFTDKIYVKAEDSFLPSSSPPPLLTHISGSQSGLWFSSTAMQSREMLCTCI